MGALNEQLDMAAVGTPEWARVYLPDDVLLPEPGDTFLPGCREHIDRLDGMLVATLGERGQAAAGAAALREQAVLDNIRGSSQHPDRRPILSGADLLTIFDPVLRVARPQAPAPEAASQVLHADTRLVQLIGQRVVFSLLVEREKSRLGRPVHDPRREAAIIDRALEVNNGSFDPPSLTEFYRKLLQVTRGFQSAAREARQAAARAEITSLLGGVNVEQTA